MREKSFVERDQTRPVTALLAQLDEGAPMKILFLDDDATRRQLFKMYSVGHLVTFAVTAPGAISELARAQALGEPFDVAYLDHDLREEHYHGTVDALTGLGVAQWIAANPECTRAVIIHSFNPDGSAAMFDTLVPIKSIRTLQRPGAWINRPEAILGGPTVVMRLV